MKVISFGDSFTAGLGVDRDYEEGLLGNHPNWDVMNEDEKNIQRNIVSRFQVNNSFTKFFSDMLKVKFLNHGEAGSSNIQIISKIFALRKQIEKQDLVIVGFTSSLRDPLPFLPLELDCKVSWNQNVFNEHKKFVIQPDEQNLSIFFKEYSKLFLNNMWEKFSPYYEVYNENMIYFLQKYFEYHEIKYILFDAFEPMIKSQSNNIDKRFYWKFGTESLFSYLKKQNNNGLLEKKGYNVFNQTPRHPSKKGHQVFAEKLFEFYKEAYDG